MADRTEPLDARRRRRGGGRPALLATTLAIASVGAAQARPTRFVDAYLRPDLRVSMAKEAFAFGGGKTTSAILVTGAIGPNAAPLFARRLAELGAKPGDVVVFNSPGGNVDQSITIGDEIRRRGLLTAVGTRGAQGRVRAGYCASACVFAFAGGTVRIGIPGSMLGVHKFHTIGRSDDPVGDAQRVQGQILSYLARMGVASTIAVEMSATPEVRWLTPNDAARTRLVTNQL